MTDQARQQPPTVVLLVRHALNDWVNSGRLAGRTPGVHLNEKGQAQANALGARLASARITAVYSSPLERALDTAAFVAQPHGLAVQVSQAVGEVEYGDWTGRELKELAKEPAWRLVQGRPSAMRFPNGESMREMQHRAVEEVERLAADHPGETIVIVSHADPIKALVAHYLGLHLDGFQRLIISPASITVLSFTPMGGLVVSLNDTAHLPPEAEGEQADG